MNACEPSGRLPANIMSDYFANTGDTFHNYIKGWCGPLTHMVSKWLRQRGVGHKRLLIVREAGEGNYLYPAAEGQPRVVWYHAIIVLDGIVHCPWLNERLTIDEYCNKMFPRQRVSVLENYSRCTDMVH